MAAAKSDRAGPPPAPTDRDVVIVRVLDAPPALVFKAWTESKHLAKWWGPRIFETRITENDFRIGGRYDWAMVGMGQEYPMDGKFLEIVPDRKIVMTADLSRHPEEWHNLVKPSRAPGSKRELLCTMTITFEDLGGRTRVTISTRFESAEVRNNMARMGMNDGWNESLDRLAELLPTI